MKTLVSVDLMRKSDEYTIKNFIDSKTLMFRAGEGVYNCVSWGDNTAIVCGSGNNAGDGYVIASLLKENGFGVTLYLLKDKFSPDGLFYFEKCRDKNIEYKFLDENTDFDEFDTIVDCIFGTGFKGEVKGLAKSVIDNINSSGKRVVSVDINSGLNGDSGEFSAAVRSDITVSVGYLKTGFYLGKAKDALGKIINCDIGIRLLGNGYKLIEKTDDFLVKALPKTVKEAEYPKGDFPVESLINLAKNGNCFLRAKNILTDGEDTYIFE